MKFKKQQIHVEHPIQEAYTYAKMQWIERTVYDVERDDDILYGYAKYNRRRIYVHARINEDDLECSLEELAKQLFYWDE